MQVYCKCDLGSDVRKFQICRELNPLNGGRRGQKIAFLASAGWIIKILMFIAKILDSNIYDG